MEVGGKRSRRGGMVSRDHHCPARTKIQAPYLPLIHYHPGRMEVGMECLIITQQWWLSRFPMRNIQGNSGLEYGRKKLFYLKFIVYIKPYHIWFRFEVFQSLWVEKKLSSFFLNKMKGDSKWLGVAARWGGDWLSSVWLDTCWLYLDIQEENWSELAHRQ